MSYRRACLRPFRIFVLILIASSVASLLPVLPVRAQAASQHNQKVLFIGGWAFLDLFNDVQPHAGWAKLRERIENSILTRDYGWVYGTRQTDFLYYSYTGKYAKLQGGTADDYTQPLYTGMDARLTFADYGLRVAYITELISAFPDASFTIVGHSSGGVLATYWAANQQRSTDPRAPINRVRAIVTIDSPLTGILNPCDWDPIQLPLLPIPAEVTSKLPESVSKARVFTITNTEDDLIPESEATLPGAWRTLAEDFGNTGTYPVPCTKGHGDALDHPTVTWALAATVALGRVFSPTDAQPAFVGSHANPNQIQVKLTYPAENVTPASQQVFVATIGNKTADVIAYRDFPSLYTYELTIKPPPQSKEGLYDIQVSAPNLRIIWAGEQKAVRYGQPTGTTATTLVMDVSGSMGDSFQGRMKIDWAKNAAGNLLTMIEQENTAIRQQHRVGIVAFHTAANLSLGLASDVASARATIARLNPGGNTNLGDGLSKAVAELKRGAGDSKPLIVVLSDGMSNTGMGRDQILNGPVREAVDLGACIYTIGFGDPGQLDEQLLRDIAARACGTYSHASSGWELARQYVYVGHSSTGNIVGDFAGVIRQGEEVAAGRISVPANQDTLRLSLNWPGSKLELAVTDPRGQQVASDYPGATVTSTTSFIYMLIKNPQAGDWNVSVLGRDVPQGKTDFSVIASVRERPSGGSSSGLIVLFGGAAAVGVIVYLLQNQSRATLPGQWAGFYVDAPGFPVRRFVHLPLAKVVMHLGRGPGNDIDLPDPQVSRRHSQVHVTAAGIAIYDIGSVSGLRVNRQRVASALLRDGDVVQLGATVLRFRTGSVQPIMPEPQSAPPHAGYGAPVVRAWLVGRSGTIAGGSFALSKPLVKIGRDGDNDIILPTDNRMSRHHAFVQISGDHFLLVDNRSVNGVYVNGRRIGSHHLRPGDEVLVGTTSFVFQFGS